MKKLSRVVFELTVLSSFASSLTALADISTATVPASAQPTVQSTANFEAPSPTKKLFENFTSTYFTVYHGAPLSDPGLNYTLDHNGKLEKKTFNRQALDGNVDLAYLIEPAIGVGAYIPFLLVPEPGQHFVLGDVGAELYNKKIIDRDGLRLGAGFLAQASTSDYSKERKQDFGLKIAPFGWYQVPHTSFKLGAWSDAKVYLGVPSGKIFKVWAIPYVNYSLTDRFSLNLGLEMEAHHMRGTSMFDFVSYQTDLQPGVVWRPTDTIIVNPYVQIFTANKLTSANTALGAVFSAKMF